jgi:hypothetical protein
MKHDYLSDGFELADLGAAAALAALGYKLLALEPTGGRRVIFVFQNEKGIGESVELYWSNRLTMDALGYFTAIKLLKSRLHAMN